MTLNKTKHRFQINFLMITILDEYVQLLIHSYHIVLKMELIPPGSFHDRSWSIFCQWKKDWSHLCFPKWTVKLTGKQGNELWLNVTEISLISEARSFFLVVKTCVLSGTPAGIFSLIGFTPCFYPGRNYFFKCLRSSAVLFWVHKNTFESDGLAHENRRTTWIDL